MKSSNSRNCVHYCTIELEPKKLEKDSDKYYINTLWWYNATSRKSSWRDA